MGKNDAFNQKILVVDDEPEVLDSIVSLLNQAGYKCLRAYSTAEAIEVYKQKRPLLVVSDLNMEHDMAGLDVLEKIREMDSEAVVLIYTGYASVPKAVMAVQKGAFDFIPKVQTHHDIIMPIERAYKYAQLKRENDTLKSKLNLTEESGFYGAVGSSPVMQVIFEKAKKVAQTNATVLISGESGTGKEVIAKGIHHYSNRRDGLYVPVVLGVLPETMMESELFGHVKGAFTGAIADKTGFFEAAVGGTILLDEITEVQPDLQQKLLRVLQERTVRRVGSVTEVPVDVRIISATNRDPEELVQKGELRSDLFYRLNIVRLHIPPLRERREDIPLMAYHFLKKYKDTTPIEVKTFSSEALMIMQNYDWPGNVRELQGAIEETITFASKSDITPEMLPERLRPKSGAVYIKPSFDDNFKAAKLKVTQQFEKEFLLFQLDKYNYNISKVAKAIDINRKTIYRLMDELGLENKNSKPDFEEKVPVLA
jgi:DNA-binding NtrC family response regulator